MNENKGNPDKVPEEEYLTEGKAEYTLKTDELGERVMSAYKKIENSVVSGYQKIEDTVINSYKKIEDKFTETFLDKK